jgi:hypothetical protein
MVNGTNVLLSHRWKYLVKEIEEVVAKICRKMQRGIYVYVIVAKICGSEKMGNICGK